MDADKFNKWQLAQVGVAQNRYERRFYRHINSLGKDISYYLADVRRVDNASKKKIDGIISELISVSNTRYEDAISEFTSDASLLANYVAETERLGLGAIASPRDVAVIAARTPIAASGMNQAEHMANLVAYNNKRLADTIRQNWALKTPMEDISALIVGTEKLRNSDGLIYKSKVSARSAIDTALHSTAMTAKAETWKANDVYRYRLVASLDSKTSDYCQSIDGRVFTWGESSSLVPPFHYFCRTVIVPELDKEYSWLSEGRTRSSAYGPVDSNITYNEWAKQNADKIAEQNEIDRQKRNRRARARRKANGD